MSEKEVEQSYNEEILGKVLGYTNFPANPFTRQPQPKTQVTGQKPDFGLGFYYQDSEKQDKTLAVIEVKDAKTDINKSQKREGNLSPTQQGFKYKPQYSDCRWVIVSNFFETKLFVDTMIDYEARTLETLLDETDNYFQFRKFYYLLCADNLIKETGKSKTEDLLTAVRIQEEQITKAFYKEYKGLRATLIQDLKKNNSDVDIEILITKAQKIIDRMVFIHFCEDNGLLPQNKTKAYVERAKEFDFEPWELLQRVFKGIDKWSDKLEIPAPWYNGGLFADDKVLDGLKVSDTICQKFIDLGRYDFAEDLSVNILGHIFEQSISDLEELREEYVEGEKETVSKRKKDWIFYTPEYIVDYIVSNSLGKYLEEKYYEICKKIELTNLLYKESFLDIPIISWSNRQWNIKKFFKVYQEYQKVLQNVKVLDPACGSGAFLVKVFDYLLTQNRKVFEILRALSWKNDDWLFNLTDLAKDILQNNIFGVDLNAESVEITKLSLWLKTAKKGKKLATLDNNVKCGNSLIDDPAVAGDKAFDWSKEFPSILKTEANDFHLLTFVTKYSRIPDEEYANKRYNWVMETGQNPQMIDIFKPQPKGWGCLWDVLLNAFEEQAEKLGIKILGSTILSDHVHIAISNPWKDISEIVNKLKWYSSFVYNWILEETKKWAWKQNTLRAKWYSNTIIKDESHFKNAISYIQNNHTKHNKIISTEQKKRYQKIPSRYQNNLALQGRGSTYTDGGFDVIVGNPPYVRPHNIPENDKKYLRDHFESIEAKSDLYACFVENSNKLLKKWWFFSFILPQTWLSLESFIKLRKFVAENYWIISFDFYDYMVFDQAQVETTTFVFQKWKKTTETKIYNNTKKWERKTILKKYVDLVDEDYNFKVFSTNNIDVILKKIENRSVKIEDLIDFKYWLKTWDDERFIHFEYKYKKDKKLLRRWDFHRYTIEYKWEFVNYEPEEMKKHKKTARPWEWKRFEDEKIMIMDIAKSIMATFDKDSYYIKDALILQDIKWDYNYKYLLTPITK